MKKLELIPVWKEITVDLETPVSAFLKLKKGGAKFLLESVEKAEKLGRYSFIGLNPYSTLKIEEEKIILDGQEILFKKPNFLKELRKILFSFKVASNEKFPPFIGGWVGYLGYDVAKFFESIPSSLPADSNLPDAILYLVKDILIFDHIKHKAKVLTLTESRENYQNAQKRIEKIIHIINSPLNLSNKANKQSQIAKPQSNFIKSEFEKIIKKAKEYILAGDIFQVVLSQKFSGEASSSPFQIYRALRMINPSPYMFFIDFDDFQLLGSSPETLVKLDKGIASVHTIAGTRPRGKTKEEDIKLEKELLASEKDIAEHVMLVDLARNDLGKVCLPDSIKITEKMVIERYSHVMHIVSNIMAKLDPKFDALDLFEATFPAGTVSGAPKIRAMEIIEQLEACKRGPYAGAVGYFGLNGNMDFCIAIRMITCQKGKYHIQSGAGIVADSIPSLEHKESRDKMQGLYQAVKKADGGEINGSID